MKSNHSSSERLPDRAQGPARGKASQFRLTRLWVILIRHFTGALERAGDFFFIYSPLPLCDNGLFIDIEMLEGYACSFCDAIKWIFGEDCLYSRAAEHQFWKIAEQ